ncbi:MAG: thioredoxin domain-containing protein [Microbacterium sp.]|uniref:DsbA family protein n=1 Tax=Microbacterium sp. TaxID=51671 RepID=UPI002629F367|nr:thioredoxin domain-containing protein [Microbacterium sp.]MCX6503460.1 thioredoxin domain-containing protein [Microbacterium sp.]
MSNDDSSNVPAPRDRREAVREKAQQVQAKHARLRTFRLVGLSALAVVVVAAVITGVVVAVNSSASTTVAAPQNVTSDGGIPITSVAGVADTTASLSDPTAAPTEPTPTASPTSASTVDIRIYVDYLASGAQEFEVANAPQLSKWFTAGSATVTYYPVAMLTAKSNGTKYSLRAASAAACVATYSPESVYAFSHELLVQQPDMDSAGMADADLAALAIAKGASSPKAVRSCIEDEDYISWAKTATDAALAGIPDTDDLTLTGTPLVLVNGEVYQGSLDDPKEFAQFVLTTASASYYKGTPTPTPSATE